MQTCREQQPQQERWLHVFSFQTWWETNEVKLIISNCSTIFIGIMIPWTTNILEGCCTREQGCFRNGTNFKLLQTHVSKINNSSAYRHVEPFTSSCHFKIDHKELQLKFYLLIYVLFTATFETPATHSTYVYGNCSVKTSTTPRWKFMVDIIFY